MIEIGICVSAWFALGIAGFHVMLAIAKVDRKMDITPAMVWTVLGGPCLLLVAISTAIENATTKPEGPHENT